MPAKCAFNMEAKWLSLVSYLLALQVLLYSPLLSAKEEFHEELLIKPLSSGEVLTYFQFTTLWDVNIHNSDACKLYLLLFIIFVVLRCKILEILSHNLEFLEEKFQEVKNVLKLNHKQKVKQKQLAELQLCKYYKAKVICRFESFIDVNFTCKSALSFKSVLASKWCIWLHPWGRG